MNLDSRTSQITEKREFCNPPAPFTIDWQAARRSVELLAALEPNAVGAGHGQPIIGGDTAQRLKEFARNFTPPRKGRYVRQPAITDESGIIALPPPVTDNVKIAVGALAGVSAGFALAALISRKNRTKRRQ